MGYERCPLCQGRGSDPSCMVCGESPREMAYSIEENHRDADFRNAVKSLEVEAQRIQANTPPRSGGSA